MTLLELIVAIIMLSVILAIGVPAFTSVIQDSRVESESARLIANLNIARLEASSRARVITMARNSVVARDWSGGWGTYTDADAGGNTTRALGNTLLRDTEPAAAGVNITTSASGNTWISFQANGMQNEGGDTVVIAICDERGKQSGRDLMINRAGRVSINSPSKDCMP
ncbi:MAG: GspH/FimT family pseudopilin [Kiritimatiellia bacterium]|nr:GspH/FimT family pseudopilin [Pseudomonadales bacterium]MDP6470911.1 GspH/FimT family pseudopilin [Pseudomonadales bacterium]MDP6825904.1 GspH/FimT family pseudopilin [Pseudomonadales bacterium]MDP7024556.1 GspH/FimT family pseudopilin [Kiritimatiellia bacterium]